MKLDDFFIIKGFRMIVFIFIVISTTTGDPRGFNKGRNSKFCVGSRVRLTPEEGRRTDQIKRFGNNKKDKDNNAKTLNDKKKINPVQFISNLKCVWMKKKKKPNEMSFRNWFLHINSGHLSFRKTYQFN